MTAWVTEPQEKFPKKFLWICIMQFRSAARKVLRTAERFSLKFWNRQRNFSLMKTLFFSIASSYLIEGKFDNPADIFSKTVEIVSIQNWNMIIISYEVFQKKSIRKKRFYGHVECSFDKQGETLWTKKSEKIGCKSENDWKKNLFLWKKFYLSKRSSGLIESSCDRPSEMFLLEFRNQQNRSSNLAKNSLKMFFLTRKVRFLERSRKLSVNVRAFFAQSLEKKKRFSSL